MTRDDDTIELRSGRPVIALDVGGSFIKTAVVARDGTVVRRASYPTGHDGAEALADQLARIADDARAHAVEAPEAIGVLIPGLIDDERGVVITATNLGLENTPLRDMLTERTGLPVGFVNDARGGALSEFVLGAARTARNALIVSIGTGIGAGVYLDGRAYDADGYGCEIGHMPTTLAPDVDAPVCICGGRSCLETFFSGAWIVRRYRRSHSADAAVTDAAQVFAAAATGDAAARAVLDQAIGALALAFAQIATILAPETIVVAGGLSLAGDALFLPLRERLSGLLTFQRVPRVVPARFGDEAGVMGAALVADSMLATRKISV
ncbi:MAG: ROK family protein [Microbacterium sp.]